MTDRPAFTIENVTTGDLVADDLALFDPLYGYERVIHVISDMAPNGWPVHYITVETRIFKAEADDYAYPAQRLITRTAEPIMRLKKVSTDSARLVTEMQELLPEEVTA